MQQPQRENTESQLTDLSSRRKLFKQYKKKLLLQVVLLLVICFCIILERIFYEVIVERENKMLSSLQWSFGLLKKSTDHGQEFYEPTGILNKGLSFYSYFGYFKVQALLFTHLVITIYTSINAIIASKILYMTILVMYGNSLLQMFYSGARPFWQSKTLFSSVCLPSYNHPSRGTILIPLMVCYTAYCLSVKNKQKREDGFSVRNYLVKFGVAFFLAIIQLVNYLLGFQYLINIGLGVIYFVTIFAFLVFLNGPIDTVIKKSTIMTIDAKRYIFYWLLYLGVMECFAIIVYQSQSRFVDIQWIQNFVTCLQYQGFSTNRMRFDEILGPWYTFLQTAIMFGLIGAVFGIAFAFRNIPKLEWYQGSVKKRVIRAAIVNLMMAPSWMLVALFEKQQNQDSWVRKLGLNDFILDSFHFFALYFILFGIVPVYVFGRLFRLNNTEKDDFYVVLGTGQELQEPVQA